MVRIDMEPVEMATLDAAVFHTVNCPQCSRPYSTPVRARVCLAGLMHYTKTVKVWKAVQERFRQAARDLEGGTE